MRKSLLLGFVLLFSFGIVFAQDRIVSGKVTSSEDGTALPGVNVVVKGTTTGAVTDLDGNFKLTVPSDGTTLVFSFIGMQSQEIVIGNQSVINIALSTDAEQLAEVVVVGYGQQSKEALTGSVAVVESDQLQQVPLASFEQSLQGNVAGLQSTSRDGAPGSNSQIRIRGIGSITASSEPLYVIDGVIVQSGDISELNSNDNRSGNVMAGINPNDIESISVLKDASSTAIYGSRGANGVILITTKGGKSGKAQINLNTLVGFNDIAYSKIMQPLNKDQYKTLFIEGYENIGWTTEEATAEYFDLFEQLIDPATVTDTYAGDSTDTNWLDEITRTGITQSYDLNVSGASEAINYYFSASYYDQESFVIGSNFERISTRLNLSYTQDWLTLSNNLMVSNFNQNGYVDGSAWANPLYNAYLMAPVIPVKDDEGRYNSQHQFYFPMGGNNPVGKLSGDDLRETKQIRVLDNFALGVNFLEDFNFRSAWSFDVISIDESQYENPRYGNGRNNGGQAQNSTVLNTSWVGTQTLGYGKTFASVHNVDGLLGYEAQKSNRQQHEAYGNNFPNDKLRTLNSASSDFAIGGFRTEFSFVSMFARFNYDYNSKYYFSVSVRRDGSSRFGANNRWGNFWSIGGSWLASNEDFLSNVDFINLLKIRTSYGITGNAAIGNFPSIGLYTYGQDYDSSPGGRPSQIGNPDLTWEQQENFNIGLDFEFLNLINGTVEYFNRVSSDLLLNVPISRTTGFTNLTQNFGTMSNKGIELTLNVTVLNTPDLMWSVGMNGTWLQNRITKLQEPYIADTKRRLEGHDYQEYFLFDWAGVDQTNGDPLYYTDSSRTATTSDVNQAERFMQGKSATPKFYGGFNTALTWKGFSLNAQFNYSVGNYLFDFNGRHINGDGRLTPRSTSTWAFENRWVPGKTDALQPMHKWGGHPASGETYTTRWLRDGTFMRLRNLMIAYQVPESVTSKLKMRSLRVYVRGTNLFTITKDKDLYMDPEQSITGTSSGLTPAMRTISLGVDFGI